MNHAPSCLIFVCALLSARETIFLFIFTAFCRPVYLLFHFNRHFCGSLSWPISLLCSLFPLNYTYFSIYHTILSSGVILISWPQLPASGEGIGKSLISALLSALQFDFWPKEILCLENSWAILFSLCMCPLPLWCVSNRRRVWEHLDLKSKICMFNKLSRWLCTLKFCNVCTAC